MPNQLQKNLELLWAERHQQPKKLISGSKAVLKQAKLEADSIAIGLAYRNLGYMDLIGGDLESAWDRLNAALETGRRYQMPELIAESSNCLAGVYRNMGNTNNALNHLENAQKIYESLHQIESLTPLKLNIGFLLQDLGRHDEAISYFYGALQTLKEYPNPIRQLEAQGNLAVSYTALGKYKEAVALLEKVIEVAKHHDLKQHQIRNLVNLGEAIAKQGKNHQALRILYQALQMLEDGLTPEGKIFCLLNIAKVQQKMKDYKDALDSLLEAKEIAIELKFIPVQAQIAHAEYEIHKMQKNSEAALEAFERYHKVHEQQRQHNAEQELRLFTLERDFEKTVAEAEISRLKTVELAQLLERVQESDRAKAQLLEELGVKTQQLEVMVKQDSLTGVHNRRFLEQVLELEFQKAQLNDDLLSLALLDLDNFKSINDQFSHHVGDQVLCTVGQLMRNCVRAKDVAARYGGEEFVLALPKASLEQAQVICERLRKSIEEYPWDEIHPRLKVTASIGIAVNSEVQNHEKLLQLADEQMYRAKRNGKNRVVTEKTHFTLSGLILEE